MKCEWAHFVQLMRDHNFFKTQQNYHSGIMKSKVEALQLM